MFLGRGEPKNTVMTMRIVITNGKGVDDMAVAFRSIESKQATRTKELDLIYVHGSAVPQPDYQPVYPEKERVPAKKKEVKKPTKQSIQKRELTKQINKNRHRALAITRGYATFLTVAAIMAVVVCVMYLQMNANIMHSSREVTGLRRQLADITATNEAAYQVVREGIDLEQIRVRAVEEMGMISVHEGRIIEYNRPTEVHVFMHHEIPRDGVISMARR